jgi:hypothetical protein
MPTPQRRWHQVSLPKPLRLRRPHTVEVIAARAPRPGRVGRLVGLTEDGGHVELLVRVADGTNVQVRVPARVDRQAAVRHTGDLRRLLHISLDLTCQPPLCRLAATTRHPINRRLPLAAALALAATGVPTTIMIPLTDRNTN